MRDAAAVEGVLDFRGLPWLRFSWALVITNESLSADALPASPGAEAWWGGEFPAASGATAAGDG